MKIPIPHTTVEKLVAILEGCYKDDMAANSHVWSDFNLVAITHDLMDSDRSRNGSIIDISDDTANWLEVVTTDSNDEDMQLIAESLQLNFSVTRIY